jgi:hypothetical protein
MQLSSQSCHLLLFTSSDCPNLTVACFTLGLINSCLTLVGARVNTYHFGVRKSNDRLFACMLCKEGNMGKPLVFKSVWSEKGQHLSLRPDEANEQFPPSRVLHVFGRPHSCPVTPGDCC